LQWFLGNYNKAGALLETVLIDNPGDVLALALSQSAYMTGGNIADVLGCAIRHNSPSHAKAHLYGYLQGILAAGYVETGRLAMAEEVALQAVSVTRGNSIWAIHSLINCYQLSGKSSDMLSKLNEFQPLHEDNSGIILLLYNKGCAHIMRGSYIAAFNSLENIASYLSDESSTELPAAATAATWRSVVLLLWKLELAMADLNIPSMFDPMWVSLAGSGYCTSVPFGNIALHDACVALVLTFAANADLNKVTKINSVVAEQSYDDQQLRRLTVKSWWSRVVGKDDGSRGDKSGGSDINTYQDLQSTILSIYGFDDEKAASLKLKVIRDKLRMHTTMNENALRGALDQISQDRVNMTNELFAASHLVGNRRPDGFCPKLMSIQPLVPQLNNRNYFCGTSPNSSLTDVEWSIIHSSGPLLKALALYQLEDYEASSTLLANIASHSHLLGGTAVERETLRSMLIET
jgi:tetratricopeptide (TPR) repeat protein